MNNLFGYAHIVDLSDFNTIFISCQDGALVPSLPIDIFFALLRIRNYQPFAERISWQTPQSFEFLQGHYHWNSQIHLRPTNLKNQVPGRFSDLRGFPVHQLHSCGYKDITVDSRGIIKWIFNLNLLFNKCGHGTIQNIFRFFYKLLFCCFKNSRVFKFKIKIGFRENTLEVNDSEFSCLI